MLSGLLHLHWWEYVVVTLILTHITIVSVTIYLHRHQAHRALDLHPIVSHFFRFWLWATTGMVTKEWVAVHRKHHAKCETVDDPHSPQIYGIKKLMLEGAELYRKEASNQQTLDAFGYQVPDDWMERHIYSKHSRLGIAIMLIVNILLFGPIGLTIWAVQMMWIPLMACGIINGIGHYWGYRNFACEDSSTNVFPIGILIGGEELHNNHHAYGMSAKLSSKWYEFDIGWFYIRVMEILRVAKVLRVTPKITIKPFKTSCDAETLQAVMTHRYDVLAKFAKSMKRTAAVEIVALKTSKRFASVKDFNVLKQVKVWMYKGSAALPESDRVILDAALANSKVLSTIYAMRQELVALWARSSLSKEQLIQQLEAWCCRAETSGIVPLQRFSHQLRGYA